MIAKRLVLMKFVIMLKHKGFKTLTVIERDKNFGLAIHIGVTEIVTRFGNVIVIEDDIVKVLIFKIMNESRVYKKKSMAYMVEIIPLTQVCLTMFCGVLNCWGWATWSDRWQYYEKNVDRAIKEFSKEIKY